jgi:CRISPR-associated endonuclease/helicase Cas3
MDKPISIPTTKTLFYQYWGKARTADDSLPYHLLPYHCLDVAALGYCLLSPETERCQRLSKQLEVDPHWLRSLFVFCLALHDLGKFSRAFQGLQIGLSEDLVKPADRLNYNQRHDSLGFALWRDKLAEHIPELESVSKFLEPWLEIVTGHHGQPPLKSGIRLADYFLEEDCVAAMQFVREVIPLLWGDFDIHPLTDKSLRKRLKPVSWQLAGIAVLADWSGSNQDDFPYYQKPVNLAEYWQKVAIPAAEKAIKKLPDRPQPQHFTNIKSLFPFINQPTSLQQFLINVELNSSPQLFILEDVTGAGKTEAALILAQRMMSQGLGNGIYIALPTMATANAMYDRLGQVYRKLYHPDTTPSLVLAHGVRDLSQTFRQSVLVGGQPFQDDTYQQGRKEDLSATYYCNAWLADSQKKALLADIGVGTVDQALLAVLPVRHQSLRLLGLDGKILLIDEVHAYDSYMQKLLGALLEAHARQGGSAILLSATLPYEMRTELVAAFHRGLGTDAPLLKGKNDYPLVTHTPAAECEASVDTREQVKRNVSVQALHNEQAVLDQVQRSMQAGHCICWIRNTVKAARKSYQDCLEEGLGRDKIHLFHSRFTVWDRQKIEEKILYWFGKDSTSEQRQGRLLIATQVVEQSLDLDFDVLITDLAPIDLVIQRAGRLHRHARDEKGNRLMEQEAVDLRDEPVLFLYTPEPEGCVQADWLKKEQPGTRAVYPHLGQLWLTAKKLLEKAGFSMPEQARELIEYVYSGETPFPEALEEASWDAEGEQSSKKSLADMNALKLGKGYTRASGDWGEETHLSTRLSEQETISVALAIESSGKLIPYAGSGSTGWLLSTVKIPVKEWQQAQQRLSDVWKSEIEQLKNECKVLRWLEVFPLVQETEDFYSETDGWSVPSEQ